MHFQRHRTPIGGVEKDWLPMINPNISGLLNSKSISIGSQDILANDVANNNVSLPPNIEANSDELYGCLISEFKWTDMIARTY